MCPPWYRVLGRNKAQVGIVVNVLTCGEKRASVATSLYSRRLAAVARPRQAVRKQTASTDAARRASAAATSSSPASSRGDGSASLQFEHMPIWMQ